MTQAEFNAWIRGRFNLWTKSDVDAEIRKAVETEREACAKLCEARAKDFLALYTRYQDEQDNGAEIAATQCARYIRARGEA